jgi:dolichyl-phosphate-mannose--protein O-mannosyl transferase
MFSANNTRFPVNSVFLKSYLIDWLCTTVVIFAISALIAEVMRKKKYFRYRYEGERGIRALKTIVFYVSMIILLLPFFRLSV